MNCGYTGTIPTEFGLLPEATELSTAGNAISWIPTEIGCPCI